MADSGHAAPRGWSNAHAPTDLRRGVGETVRQSSAVPPRSHHEPSPKDRARSRVTAGRDYGARRWLSHRAPAMNLSVTRLALRWALWLGLTAAATILLVRSEER